MAQFKATFDGGIVADPETKEVAGNKVLEFPVYINHSKKNKDTEQYEKTGDVTKVRVSLWRDDALKDFQKGDIVQITAQVVEKEFKKRDGTDGRQLQTSFVESIELKWRKEGAAPAAQQAAPAGAPADSFVPAGAAGWEGKGF